LESKIRIISPAIDMIELIAARGNTSLESAVSLTKTIRWDIQKLGVKLAKAASEAENLRRRGPKVNLESQNEAELQVIVVEMKLLLDRIEDAVPLINLAITTSGVSLSTNLPATISPSRLLQASTFLSAGDAQYLQDRANFTQIGPTFTLSLYMLFAGHAHLLDDNDGLRSSTWKEVIHKTQVKLVRVPINRADEFPLFGSNESSLPVGSDQEKSEYPNDSHRFPARELSDEFAYQLSMIEDLNDNRVHSFGDDEAQPGPLNDLALAGLRAVLPIHEVSKIFYADTGKILNIGSEGETNNPVLLLKRDFTATPPRRMMEAYEEGNIFDYDEEGDKNYHNDHSYDPDVDDSNNKPTSDVVDDDSDAGYADDDTYLQAQFARETKPPSGHHSPQFSASDAWRLPSDLDPEWLAFEVYVEAAESESDDESDSEVPDSSPTKPPNSRGLGSQEPQLSIGLENLNLRSSSLPSDNIDDQLRSKTILPSNTASMSFAAGGSIRTSLSLLEMLIRLTSLQQFQQSSHLAITDELLNFFLEESSTTGAAPGDTDSRKRIRMEARQRVGFDPYDESPIKRRGESYQTHPEGYEQGYHDAGGEQANTLPSREKASRQPTPLRLRSGSSRSRSGTPEAKHFRSSPSPLGLTPLSGMEPNKEGSLATSPGSIKSRKAFIREESTAQRRGSSLAR